MADKSTPARRRRRGAKKIPCLMPEGAPGLSHSLQLLSKAALIDCVVDAARRICGEDDAFEAEPARHIANVVSSVLVVRGDRVPQLFAAFDRGGAA